MARRTYEDYPEIRHEAEGVLYSVTVTGQDSVSVSVDRAAPLVVRGVPLYGHCNLTRAAGRWVSLEEVKGYLYRFEAMRADRDLARASDAGSRALVEAMARATTEIERRNPSLFGRAALACINNQISTLDESIRKAEEELRKLFAARGQLEAREAELRRALPPDPAPVP